jgi:hypothetical protein
MSDDSSLVEEMMIPTKLVDKKISEHFKSVIRPMSRKSMMML